MSEFDFERRNLAIESTSKTLIELAHPDTLQIRRALPCRGGWPTLENPQQIGRAPPTNF
jgi:hypothetical protein